jgi:hypothetical protein
MSALRCQLTAALASPGQFKMPYVFPLLKEGASNPESMVNSYFLFYISTFRGKAPTMFRRLLRVGKELPLTKYPLYENTDFLDHLLN